MNASARSSRDHARPGISAISIYLPRNRVDLERWCEWTGAPWAKVAAVVGRSFRVCAPDENVYTMAANAALQLIEANGIDPRRVGYFALGTESSTDNAAGAVIVRGMVDEALRVRGLPSLARDCEVPEFKHACLGGVYAMKSAARYLACEGRERVAIVVSSDIAAYRRGSTGEQTQGAGAVAFAMEAEPKLLALDLDRAGSASSYRGYDFRKPFARHFMADYRGEEQTPRDFPVFNGKYSTLCYVDEVIAALDAMFGRQGLDGERRSYYESLAGIFFHRPYHHLPSTALATALTWDLARQAAGSEGEARAQLAALCEQAGVSAEDVLAQVDRRAGEGFDLWAEARAQGADHDPFAAVTHLAKLFRKQAWYRNFSANKLGLGAELVRQCGNLYTASLPAWIAAGFDDACRREAADAPIQAGSEILLIGYGSGDAAEAIPATVMPTWREAAATIGFEAALANANDLDREQYEALHDGRAVDGLASTQGFVIREVGSKDRPDFADIGMEYYDFV